MGELGLCAIGDLGKTIATQLLSDITTDGGIPMLLVRLLHNKLTYGVFFSLRCYLLYVDLSQLIRFVSPLFLPFIAASCILKPWRKPTMMIFLLFPLFMIANPFHFSLEMRIHIFRGFYIALAIIGCIKVVKLILKSKH